MKIIDIVWFSFLLIIISLKLGDVLHKQDVIAELLKNLLEEKNK